MPNIAYPFDPSGLSPVNLIPDEIHVLTEINDTTYRIIVPEFAPFYLDNFKLVHRDSTGVESELTVDVDYYFCLPYIGASRSIGKMVYGGVSINKILLNGTLKLTYQTLGGDWNADSGYVLERLAEYVYNPRTTIWDIVTNKQEIFPPINHDQNLDYIYGHQDLIGSINSIADKITEVAGQPHFVQHLINLTNPHQVTKEQVGLSEVSNLALASNNEVIAREPVDKYVTLKQLIEHPLPGDVDITIVTEHIANIDNPHQVTKAAVGLSEVVNLPLASVQEVLDQTPAVKYVTLEQVLQLLETKSDKQPIMTAQSYYFFGLNK